MRTLLRGTLGSLLALLGFAATANAAQTIDLLWGGTSTSTSAATSSTIILNVVLTNDGPLLSQGGGMTIDYSAVIGNLTVVSFANFVGGPFALQLGSVTDTGTQIRNINAAAFVPYVGTGLGVGASYLLGTVTFHKTAGPAGTFNITSVLTATDDFVDSTGAVDTVTLNAASLTNVSEPGTVALLAFGLGGLALAGGSRRP